jgi:hypothetical protein
MINWNTGEGIPSVLLLFVTKYIIIHRIQYHVSRFEHQNILGILAETPCSFTHLFFTTINNDKRYFQSLAIFVNKKSVI